MIYPKISMLTENDELRDVAKNFNSRVIINYRRVASWLKKFLSREVAKSFLAPGPAACSPESFKNQRSQIG